MAVAKAETRISDSLSVGVKVAKWAQLTTYTIDDPYLRTLLEGDRKAGFTVFWADDGLDTGPVLLQKETDVDINDTVDSLYTRFLYPEGIRAMVCTD